MRWEARFRAAWKDVAEGDVVGAVACRRYGFVQVMDRAADEQPVVGQARRGRNREALGCEVDTVGSARQGNVHAIVDRQSRVTRVCEAPQLQRLAVHGCS